MSRKRNAFPRLARSRRLCRGRRRPTLYDGSSRLVKATIASATPRETNYWYAPSNGLVHEVKTGPGAGEITRFKGFQDRDGVAYANVLP